MIQHFFRLEENIHALMYFDVQSYDNNNKNFNFLSLLLQKSLYLNIYNIKDTLNE